MKKLRRLRKGLAMLLSLAMVVGLMPGAGTVKVSAAEISLTRPSGEGTANSPYQIGTAAELYWFAALVNGDTSVDGVTEANKAACAKLTADIKVNEGVLDNEGNLNFGSFTAWTPISTDDEYSYTGTFDGENHTISGLYFNDTSNYIGLFGIVGSGSQIRNVGIVDSYFNGKAGVGGVCGYCTSGEITNCYNTGTVIGTVYYIGGVCGYSSGSITDCYNAGNVSGTSTSDQEGFVGGVCGGIDGYPNISTITRSYNSGKVSGGYYVGGVCGANGTGYPAQISNCYNTGEVGGTGGNVGGICGYNGHSGSRIENCYNSAAVSGGSCVGSVCGFNSASIAMCYYMTTESKLSGVGASGDGAVNNAYGKTTTQFNSGEVCYLLNASAEVFTWRQNLNSDNLPVLDESHGKVYASAPCPAHFSNSPSGVAATEHSYKDGVCEVCGGIDISPEIINGIYQLKTSEQLYWFAEQVNGGRNDLNAVLVHDIIVNTGEISASTEDATAWKPIGNKIAQYTGTFDGKGHTISGLYFNDTSEGSGTYIGLFGYVGSGGSISNVGVVNSYLNARQYIGGICGLNYGTITNCYSQSTVNTSRGCIGGICGLNYKTITNCYNIGIVGGSNANIGGVCGPNHGKITDCYYLDGCNATGITFDCLIGTSKTIAQFSSGEVAYLLNEGKTDNDVVWRQTLNTDTAPVLDSTHSIVYASKPCESEFANTEITTEKKHTVTMSEDGTSHTCSVCKKTEQHADVATFTLDEANHSITATCPSCGNLGTITLSASDATYDGANKAASISGEIKGFDTPSIVYKKKAENGSFETINTTPKDAGTYRASITYTVDETNNKVYSVSTEYTIARRPVTITANDVSKTYGESDPELSYTVSEDTPLVGDETLGGTLSREEGGDAGTYKITQGTVTNDGNPNYDITFNKGTLTINKANTNGTANCEMVLQYDENSGSYTATITNVENAEYKFGESGEWNSNNTLTGIAHGTEVTGYIRIAGDDNHNPGAESSKTLTSGHGTLKYVEAKEADCVNEGNEEYWYCESCGKYFSDAEGTKETTKDAVTNGTATGHQWDTETYMFDATHHWHNCKNENCPVTDNSQKDGYGEHIDTDNNSICDTCGAKISFIITGCILTENGASIEGNMTGLANYKNKEEVTLTVPVIAGYNFVGWYVCSADSPHYTGENLCTSRTYKFTAEEDRDLVAVYKPIGSAELTINGGRSFTINGDNRTTEVTVPYPLGSQIEVVCNDSDFEYWKNSAGMVVSRDKSYTFTVTGKETISAVFNTIAADKATVVFESYYGQVIARDQYAAGATLAETPGLPFRYGYTALGWDYNGDGTYNAETDTFAKALERGFASENKLVTILPVYQLNETTYQITVENGTGAGTYKQNEVVTVVANAASEGYKFSHWADNAGNILSYNEKYQFYAAKSITVTAVYVEDAEKVEAKGTTEIIDKYADKANGKLTFVSMSTVPDGCTIDKAGVIATNDQNVAESGDGFNADTAVYVRGNSWTGNAYRYTWTKSKVGSGETWYVRAYLVYTDAEGNVNTVYGDMVSLTMQ